MHKRVNPDSCCKLLIVYLNEMIKHFVFPVIILLKYQVMCISVYLRLSFVIQVKAFDKSPKKVKCVLITTVVI